MVHAASFRLLCEQVDQHTHENSRARSNKEWHSPPERRPQHTRQVLARPDANPHTDPDPPADCGAFSRWVQVAQQRKRERQHAAHSHASESPSPKEGVEVLRQRRNGVLSKFKCKELHNVTTKMTNKNQNQITQ